jgi:hypothetical protein
MAAMNKNFGPRTAPQIQLQAQAQQLALPAMEPEFIRGWRFGHSIDQMGFGVLIRLPELPGPALLLHRLCSS